MMFLDRLTGGKLSRLPDALLPGRYCLLEPLLVNGHSRLQPGDLLSDDGSGVIRTQDTESQVLAIDQSDDDQADCDLSAEAIISIAGKIAHAHDANVSPMLPAEMAAQCALEELERDLAVVLRDGHLHSISDRPRRDLRYDDLVAPVARARRLATSALSHLASHSDCWQQRTLSGVQPRKVLARFSEDDYAIYENRLYKRLLDRLDRHLARRLARIRGVNSRLERALEFQDSEQTHFRLRQDICRLWGESYLDDKTGTQLEAGTSVASPQSLPVSPLDLYVVEKVGKLIDEWMLRQLLQGHGRKLGPLPTPAKRLTEAWPEQFESISPTHVRLLAPLDAQKAVKLKASLKDSANSQVEDAVGVAIEQVIALAQLCGHPARFERGQQQDFYCQCGTCQVSWALNTTGKRRQFSMRPKGASNIPEANGFVWSGRDWLEFDLGVDQ